MKEKMQTRSKTLGFVLGLAVVATICLLPGSSEAKQVKLDVQLSSPVMLSGQSGTAYLKVSMTGFNLPLEIGRAPANVAIVLDRSGSMSGHKLRKAKAAAKMAVSRLGPDDIVSIVAYDSTVEVLVPATKVIDKHIIMSKIDNIYSSGNTALFAGVSKGAREVRKFSQGDRINRVILLSDGLANVGPSSAGELGSLGHSLIKEGISVTTIGLGSGYNEDLMARLAQTSDGNHAFAENADDLATIFNYEFSDILSVIARDVNVEIYCGPGIHPIRVLGREAQIYGRKIVTKLGQLYAEQEKFLLIEVNVPASLNGTSREIAAVSIRYDNTVTRATDVLMAKANVAFSDSSLVVSRSYNNSVMISSIEAVGNEDNRRAVELRDQGRTDEARRLLKKNAQRLQSSGKKYKSKKLKDLSEANALDSLNLDGDAWKVQRKRMRKRQHTLDNQQAY